MEDFRSPSTMGVCSRGSGEESDISQQYVSRNRWHVRRGRSCRRVTVIARSSRGRRGKDMLVQGLVEGGRVEDQSIQAVVVVLLIYQLLHLLFSMRSAQRYGRMKNHNHL